MIQVDLFDDDERQYLNSIVKGSDRNQLTKKSVLTNIAFAREAMDSTETMLVLLILQILGGSCCPLHLGNDGILPFVEVFYPSACRSLHI